MRSPSSIMAPLFANQSCDPFTAREVPCTLGNYAAYTVNVSKSKDVVAALNFAKQHDIRVVIRNTGHDYLGRSTGAGSIAIWTHHLKNTEIIEWRDDAYEGKALKVGAGVQGFEALAAAKEQNLVVVTGECPTVGVVGGYLQGGGHSGLSTSFGLAADNVLSFEVVTAAGQLLTASRSENEGLFWSLAGGGGGTFGIVVAATMKAHPDAPVAGTSFNIALPEGSGPDLIYAAIDIWHAELPRLVDAGIMVIYFFGDGFLQVPALTAYNKTVEQLQSALQPIEKAFEQIGVYFNPAITSFPSYHDHYDKYWGPLPEGNIQVGM
jgi:FAD/FMN-containing dehydrogenase